MFQFPGSERLMIQWYKATGKNQRPHILRVVSDAQLLCVRLHLEYTRELELACVLHDVAKGRDGWSGDHGESSAKLAANILRGTLFLDDATCTRICTAIWDHNHQDVAPVSKLSALLRSADAGVPSVGFYARKSVSWCLSRLFSQAAAYQNAFSRLKRGDFLLGGGGEKIAIPEYSQGFAKEIWDAKSEISALISPEEIQGIIDAYNASPGALHPEA